MYKLAFALLAAGTVNGTAYAADTFLPVQNGYEWSGFYAGIGGGAGAVIHELSVPGLGSLNGLGGEGVFGEVTVGYDHMFTPRFLGGIYADARYGNIGPTLDIGGFGASANADYGFDVLARAGYLLTPRTPSTRLAATAGSTSISMPMKSAKSTTGARAASFSAWAWKRSSATSGR